MRVVLFQNRIMEYRVPVFNRLNKHFDLTIIYTEGEVPCGCECITKRVPKKKGKLFWKFNENIKKITEGYEVAILPMDLRQIDYLGLILTGRIKTISWGIGVNASYDTPFDSGKVSRLLKWIYIKKTDACIFYSDYARQKYLDYVDKRKLFVADNTVEVNKISLDTEKTRLLFIGSLYKEKLIFELLYAYRDAYKECSDVQDLYIIGEGIERDSIERFINHNKLGDKIHLCGQIFDENTLAEMFRQSIACISPNQAGLSVLKSMGYGVCFITHKNAITGGERLNISNGINGVLFEDFSNLKTILLDIANNPGKYIFLGEEAYQYYWHKRTPEHMVEGFVDAIEYVSGLKR